MQSGCGVCVCTCVSLSDAEICTDSRLNVCWRLWVVVLTFMWGTYTMEMLLPWMNCSTAEHRHEAK